MTDALEILGSLIQKLGPLTQTRSLPGRAARGLLAELMAVVGARSGALHAWKGSEGLILSANQGLSSSELRRVQKADSNQDPEFSEALAEIKWPLLSPRQGLASGYKELDRFIDELAGSRWVAVWPLTWAEGRGLAVLVFDQALDWPQGLGRIIAGYLDLALDSILLRSQSESRHEDYRRIFENSKDMIYLSSRDGRWMDVNPAGVAMLGYASREELLAVPDIAQAAYFHADDRRLFQEAIEKYGYVKDYEVTFKRKDGTPIDVSITADVRETQGEIQGYEGIIKDITARKQAQAQAERERRLVSSILEVTPVGIFMMDEGHRIIHWNRACEELTGVKRGIILGQDKAWEVFQRPEGQTLADLVLNQDYDSMWEIYGSRGLRRSPVMEDAWEAEGHFENLGGRPKEVFFSATTLKDEKGKIVGAVEAILDLTEIYELEVQLTESEQLYRTLVESSQQGITLHSGDEFVFANQAFLEMFGLKDLGGVHGDFLQMIAPEHKRPYLEWMRQLREQGEYPGVFEGKGLREGKSFDLEMDAGEVRYKGQKAILFTVRDISWRKGMEEQLIRSERLAATGKLAFDLAHEVNNPLGGILTYAHLIAEDLEPGSTPQANAEKIIKLTNRCRIIVRGLLDFARDDGPEKEAMDLNHVFQDVLSLVEGHMIMKDIRLNIELAPDLPRLYGHRTKMEQVILNMVINAAEAMEGKGDLEVSTWAEGGQVRMRFKDTGHGLSGEAARKVFEPFFTTKDRGRGTGLGLSISHGIIKQHGGKIELESSPGRGASFTLVLPTEKGREAKK